MIKKLLAVFLALSFIFAFAACDKRPSGTGTDGKTTTSSAEDPFASFDQKTEPAAESSTDANVPGTVPSETSVETTILSLPAKTDASEPVSESSAPPSSTAAAQKAPQTKAEIVEYFNIAINGAKKNSKSITSKYLKNALAGKPENIPGALDSIAQKLIKDHMGEDKKMRDVVWTTAEEKNARFPVEGETWASKLAPADVKSARLDQADGKYKIKITTAADPRSETYTHGSGHAPKAFNVILPGIIDGYIPGFIKKPFKVGTVAMSYPSSDVAIIVDAASGRVLDARYKLYWTIHIPLGEKDVILPFSTETGYAINW